MSAKLALDATAPLKPEAIRAKVPPEAIAWAKRVLDGAGA
jgi:hypothetical protein